MLLSAQLLRSALAQRFAVVGVVGIAYVDRPLALRGAETGFKSLGLDADAQSL